MTNSFISRDALSTYTTIKGGGELSQVYHLSNVVTKCCRLLPGSPFKENPLIFQQSKVSAKGALDSPRQHWRENNGISA